jgi:NAD-dependent dihydropyrimidine dehydrogenase PreA subunit
VLRIPHLYDLAKDGQTFKTLQAVTGDIVLITWLFTRAAHWILDRNGVQGQVGHVELVDEQEEGDEAQSQLENEEPRVADSRPRPDRQIFSLDFRVSSNPHDYSVEMQRIQQSLAMVEGVTTSKKLTLEMLTRFEQPTNDTYVGSSTAIPAEASEGGANLFGESSVRVIEEHPSRRWYPVIDFSRCTNCMECIDFCLFGVYGVDSLETIVVEQADNCRKGCPACSRVCPQNAIIFPQHKTPAIAGAPVDAGGLKIDLSKLFGAPDDGEDAAAAAIRERDEQLVLAGRQAVGTSTGISERLAERAVHLPEPDALDDLIDQLDSLDL